MDRKRINIVVTCTARKTEKVPRELHLRSVAGVTLVERFAAWANRIGDKSLNTVPAVELYCGGAWSIVRRLYTDPEVSARLRIWIVSAGQGLLSPETPVVPYAATFSNGHRDSVITPGLRQHRRTEWWNELIVWRKRQKVAVASLTDIAKTHPDEPLLVALSTDYLAAIQPDLEAARAALISDDQMVIICAGAKKVGALEPNFLPCDARFENHFRCVRGDLNTRLLGSIVETYQPGMISAATLQKTYKRKISQLSEACHPKRIRSSDEDVERFIGEQLTKDGEKTHTNLLRSLRSSGYACEQGRFRQLFRKIQRTLKS